MRKFSTLAVLGVLGCAMVAGCGSSGSPGEAKKNPTGKSADQLAQTSAFGSMENVCHEAKGTNKANSDRGVTADSVRITTISDAGSSLQPGLNQEFWDAATVFTRWCNDHGGINGRKITMTKGNAQVAQYKQTIEQACKTEFALVGGGGALDDQGQEERVGCKLVALPGFQASATARGAPLSYPAVSSPIGERTDGAEVYLSRKYGGNQRTANVYGLFETTKFTTDQQLATIKNIGSTKIDPQVASDTSPVNEVGQQTFPVTGLDDWSLIADGITHSAAVGLTFTGQPPDLGALLNTLAASDNDKLQWVLTYPNQYDQVLIKDGRAGLSRYPVYLSLYQYPFEEAGEGEQSLAMDEYLALFKKYLPEGKARAMLGVSGFASWLLFAKAANACGTNLTRKCLVKQIKKITEFDAGGLIAPRDPSDSTKASECFVVMKATNKGFERVNDQYLKPTPGKGVFTCGKQYVFHYDLSAPPMKQWADKVEWTPAQAKQLEASLP